MVCALSKCCLRLCLRSPSIYIVYGFNQIEEFGDIKNLWQIFCIAAFLSAYMLMVYNLFVTCFVTMKTRKLYRAVHTGSKTPLSCRSTVPFVSMRSMPSIIRLSRRSFLAPPAKWSRRAISCVAVYSLVASRWS